MKAGDLNYAFNALVQHATGYIDYGTPVAGVKATGVFTIVDYLKAILTKATQTLTVSGNAVDDETVTIGSTVYRWKTVIAQAYDVAIGIDAATSLDNLKAAINASRSEERRVGKECRL